ncbi:MAG: ribosomal protein S18 acetylase RimI-like enzyme [Parvicella sp.]|jgi:ribosomal protein S18 acetylase RimI-like enzyme
MNDIRQLGRHEHQLIGDVIGDSFSDDPMNTWIFGTRECMSQYYALMAKKLYLSEGYGDLAIEENGGSLWLPPGKSTQIPLYRSLDIAKSMVTHNGIKSLMRGLAVDSALAKVKPKEPHFYLLAIGVRPNHQGKGIGGELMNAGLQRVDHACMPAYLESSKEINIPFYQRFGFEVTEKLLPAKGAPPLWLMWREAR